MKSHAIQLKKQHGILRVLAHERPRPVVHATLRGAVGVAHMDNALHDLIEIGHVIFQWDKYTISDTGLAHIEAIDGFTVITRGNERLAQALA